MAKINISEIETLEAFQKFLSEKGDALKHGDTYEGAFVEENVGGIFRNDRSLKCQYWTPEIRASWDAVKPKGGASGESMAKKREYKQQLLEIIGGMKDQEKREEALRLLELIVPEKQGAAQTTNAVKLFGSVEVGAEHYMTDEEMADMLAFTKSLVNVNAQLKKEGLTVAYDMPARKVRLVALVA